MKIKKVQREVAKDISFPLGEDDPELNELAKQSHELRKRVKVLELKINLLKNELKPIEKEFEETQDKIATGKTCGAIVVETIDFKDNIVRSIIKDSGEELPDREITEKDRENNVGDIEVD